MKVCVCLLFLLTQTAGPVLMNFSVVLVADALDLVPYTIHTGPVWILLKVLFPCIEQEIEIHVLMNLINGSGASRK